MRLDLAIHLGNPCLFPLTHALSWYYLRPYRFLCVRDGNQRGGKQHDIERIERRQVGEEHSIEPRGRWFLSFRITLGEHHDAYGISQILPRDDAAKPLRDRHGSKTEYHPHPAEYQTELSASRCTQKSGICEKQYEFKCKNNAQRRKAACQLTTRFDSFFHYGRQAIAQKSVNRGVEGLGNELQTLHIGQRVSALPIAHALMRDVCGSGQLGLRQSRRFPQGANARADLRCDIHLSPPFHMGHIGKQLLNEQPRPRGDAMRRPLLMPQFYPLLPAGSTVAMQKPLCIRALSPFPWRRCSL